MTFLQPVAGRLLLAAGLACVLHAGEVGTNTNLAVTIQVDATRTLRPFTELDRAMDPHWLSWLADPAYIAQYPRLRADGFEIARIIGVLSAVRIYREDAPPDADGNPVCDFQDFDAMLAPLVEHGLRPMLVMNFVPDALAVTPSAETKDKEWWNNDSEVKDYARWDDLIRRTLRHCQERWGRDNVAGWLCETWNEGDYGDYGLYQGRANFLEFQDHTVNAIKTVDSRIRVGGPGTVTSTYKRGGGNWTEPEADALYGIENPTRETAPDWRDSVEHFARGRNFVTGATGTPIDFITSHMYDLAGTVDSGKGIDVIAGWMVGTVRSFAELGDKPVLISEWSSLAREWPHDTMYESVRAVRVLMRSRRRGLSGIVHHSQATPPNYRNRLFTGYPSLYTLQGPVRTALGAGRALYNRLAGVEVAVRGETAAVGAIAAADGSVVRLLVSYCEPDAGVEGRQEVKIRVLWPAAAGRQVQVREHRLDRENGNARVAWEAMGKPETADPEQLAQLRAAAEIPRHDSTVSAGDDGLVPVRTVLPAPALRLFELRL